MGEAVRALDTLLLGCQQQQQQRQEASMLVLLAAAAALLVGIGCWLSLGGQMAMIRQGLGLGLRLVAGFWVGGSRVQV
jgi:hypothetical protein